MATALPWRASCLASSTTCFWAPPRPRSLIVNSTRMLGPFVAVAQVPGPALAPHLEREQEPHFLHVDAIVRGAAVTEIGDRRRHHHGIEKPGIADALRIEVLVDQRREVAPQPARERNREALLGPLDQVARQAAVEDLAQQVLGAERAAPHG